MPAVTGLVPLIAWNWQDLAISVTAAFGELRSNHFTYPNRNIVNENEEGAADANVKERRRGDCSLRRNANWYSGDVSKPDLYDHKCD